MLKAVKVRGWFSDPTHIELEQAVPGLIGPVEVILRPLASAPAPHSGLLGICSDLGRAPAGVDIDDIRAEMFSRFVHADGE